MPTKLAWEIGLGEEKKKTGRNTETQLKSESVELSPNERPL